MMNQSIVSTSSAPCSLRGLSSRTTPFRTVTVPQKRSPVVRSRGQLRVSAAAYICKDCGWIYEEKGSAAFKDLPSSFKCPVCTAPKRRFGTYSGPKGGNTKAAMDDRYAKLQSGAMSAGGGGASGSNVAVITGAGLVGLAGLYFFLQSQY